LRNKAVLEEEDLKPLEKLLFLYLKETKGKPTTVATISKHTGLNYKTVYKTISSMEEKGVLTRGRVNHVNVYEVTL
jgi:DNA-binding MarR family transcriptional regulator